MIKRLKLALMLSVTVLLTQATSAFAGDAATVIFESGLVIKIDDGFTQLIKRMSSLNRNSSDHVIEQLNIGGSTFALNLAQVLSLIHISEPTRPC